MQVQERNLKEIQEKAGRMSDFLRMEYLESAAEKFHEVEIHRYCYLELSRLYEARKMYSDAIKYIFKYQETLVIQTEKNKAMFKEIELLIRAGQYERADLLVKKLMENSKEKEKFELIRKVVDEYKKEALVFEKQSKNAALAKVYEKLLFYLSDAEKNDFKRKLAGAYKKLGKVRESLELERSLERNLA
jgi:hypothetical protein